MRDYVTLVIWMFAKAHEQLYRHNSELLDSLFVRGQ